MASPVIATYRVQLRSDFGFSDVAAIVGYLKALGISHVYCSPCLQAAPGSTHGYDVVDPTRVSEELGGEAGFANLCNVLTKAEMGLILDIVPNHMAIGGAYNAWWWDVLENGPASIYASHFDVDWDPPQAKLRDVILLPILGDRYGQILESGEIKILRTDGRFVLCYHDHELPVAPRSLESLLGAVAERLPPREAGRDELAFLAGAFGRLPRSTELDAANRKRRRRDKAVLSKLLARLCAEQPRIGAAIDELLDIWRQSSELMDAFLQSQNYRVAYWRNADRELGYRRFFDINTLIALRVEENQVFEDTHDLILRLVQTGAVDGLRVDHIDGLRFPFDYLKRLRRAAPDSWIVVEKILQPNEQLPSTWPIAGTTGYDFLNHATGVLIDPQSESAFTEFYAEFTGESVDFHQVARDRKSEMLRTILGSDLTRLTTLLLEVSDLRPVSWDFTSHELQAALREILTDFSVYRTYVEPQRSKISESDIALIHNAVAASKSRREDLDTRVLDFIQDLLLCNLSGEQESEFVLRFQQLSSTAIAKGVEDTAFYSFNRFVALNEVGGVPESFGLTIPEFHAACVYTQINWPQTMLASSTHDTKRSEDVRARLVVLSELPEEWCDAVSRWSASNEKYRTSNMPDRNAEYLFYQVLVGAWPINTQRMNDYMLKAVREAKQFTSWATVDEDYEAALKSFVENTLADTEFCKELEQFVLQLVVPGRINSLAQTLLKLTAPGIPDIYQGNELWDLSLVDPDNRRAIDYSLRAKLCAELQDSGWAREGTGEVPQIADDGLAKLWVTRAALAVRRRYPAVFGGDVEGEYRPLVSTGDRKDSVIAFVRGERCVTVVPRFFCGVALDGWGETLIEVPEGQWRDEISGQRFAGGQVDVGELLEKFPVALLIRV